MYVARARECPAHFYYFTIDSTNIIKYVEWTLAGKWIENYCLCVASRFPIGSIPPPGQLQARSKKDQKFHYKRMIGSKSCQSYTFRSKERIRSRYKLKSISFKVNWVKTNKHKFKVAREIKKTKFYAWSVKIICLTLACLLFLPWIRLNDKRKEEKPFRKKKKVWFWCD